ncbi:MAG: hypothetical protein IKC26_09945 [Clostridia bacterium]|nr:hypothetical protein [Clostridia bacterium]MBR2908343.1 hypothetical protein [Clostridia bacterium]
MFYLCTVATAILLIALGNFLSDGIYRFSAFGWQLLTALLGVAAVFLIDALFAFLTRRLPEKWFLPEARFFSVGKREKDFYRKTKINTWKKHVPEWGCFTGFHKDKMQDPNDSTYLGRFLTESNYGVAGHVAGAFFGFLILLIPPLRPLTVALPIAVINMILSLLPTMILRFNTPALRRLYRRNLEREAREAEPLKK